MIYMYNIHIERDIAYIKVKETKIMDKTYKCMGRDDL